jgi:carboxyl-terminal processing protease
MTIRSFSVARRIALAVWLAVALVLAAPLQAQTQSLVLTNESERQAWTQAADHVLLGQFAEVQQSLTDLLREAPDESSLHTLAIWLNQYEAQQKQRDEYRREDYAHYVERVVKHLDADELADALEQAGLTTYYGDTEDAVRNEPWYAGLIQRAAARADDLRKKGQWVDAANLYFYLHQLEEDNAAYKEGYERCQHHARLELLYGPDSHWKEMVEDIHPIIVRNALRRIQSDYVREADFKELTVAGLEDLLTLAGTPDLAKEKGFEKLADHDLVTRFTGQIQSLIAELQQREQISSNDAMTAFSNALEVNDRTLELPPEVVVFEFMDAGLEKLDSFSSIIWPAEMEEFKKQTIGEFVGVGIQIMQEQGVLKVVTPLEDTPAYRAGIQPGDLIIAVDGEDIKGVTVNQAIKQITGERGTQVVLTIQRNDGKPFDVPIIRDVIHIQTVKGFQRDKAGQWDFMVDPIEKVGYVRLTSFTESSAADLREVLEKLHDEGMRGLILDLRFNPGGLLRAATEVSDLFLRDGVIVSTRGAHTEPWESTAHAANTFSDFPVVVLINEASASASEIVAGALQENNHRAVVVGERSFGKGSVQYLLSVAGRSAFLKLTTALYYLPSGRSLHREEDAKTWGVEPDIMVKVTPNEIRKVWAMWRDRDVLPGLNGPDVPVHETPAKAADKTVQPPSADQSKQKQADDEADEGVDLDARPDVDPQLETGLLIMRVKLLSDRNWPQLAPQRLAEAGAN